jgi:hypothetical protein
MKHLKYLVLAVVTSFIVTASAAGHPDHGPGFGREDFPGEGVAIEDQHGVADGHLPAVNRNVRLVGKAEITNPSGASNDGRVADVAAYGNFAYLTAFRDPTCVAGGAHTVNIADPAHPFEVPSAFMPTTPENYAGEGAQTLAINNAFFNGVVFIHQNETCPNAPPASAPRTRGGINIWNITNPLTPVQLAAHAGDYTSPSGAPEAQANQTHSMFAWNSTVDGKTYVVLVDDEELTDVDIMDITNPANPVMVNDSLNLQLPPFSVGQDSPSNLTSIFSHDMVVKRVGDRYVMNVNYWDGGYVLLDVTNPTPGNVTLIAESDYAQLDEERLARGHQISPEGNAHQSELSPNNRFLIGTDEDFNPYRVVGEITSGPYDGTEYSALSASGTPPIDPSTSISGTPTYVGEACSPLPPGSGVALVERGTCFFQVKLDNITAAGYSSGIVFNNLRPDCQAFVFMGANGTIPFVFVQRLTGLQLLQVAGVTDANACTTASPASGSPSASTTIEAIFDGWGYVRLFRTHIPGEVGATGSISQLDTYAIPESQDPAYATGFGTLSVHEVAMDPKAQGNKGLAYISYYSGGFRVVEYTHKGIEEVGAFIDEGGNDFWGVEVHNVGKEQYVLASDRDYGLYIFQYDPKKDKKDKP